MDQTNSANIPTLPTTESSPSSSSSSWETEQASTNLLNFVLVANFEEINFVGYGASSLLQLHRIINSLAGLNEPD